MKIILDECVPKQLVDEISGHEVTTVPLKGWSGVKNGELLSLVEKEFDVFVTVDSNLAFQQDVKNLKISVFVLHGATSRFSDLKELIPSLMEHLEKYQPNQLVHINS